VRELCAIGPCEINVVHVNWPPEEAGRVGYHGELPLTENPDQLHELLERDVRERIALILPREAVTVTILPGWDGPTPTFFRSHRKRISISSCLGPMDGAAWIVCALDQSRAVC